ENKWPWNMEVPGQVKRDLKKILCEQRFYVALVTDRTVRDGARILGLNGRRLIYLGEDGMVWSKGMPTPENLPTLEREGLPWLEPAVELTKIATGRQGEDGPWLEHRGYIVCPKSTGLT